MFDADRPITQSEQDRLGRAVFAKYLARAILDHSAPESFVIGLYGGWGSGKTSIINLVLQELHLAAGNSLDEEKPVILNFSPWSYSGQHQLVYSFFRRLSSEIKRSPWVLSADRIIELLELYVSFFTHQPVPRAFRPKKGLVKKIFGFRKNHDDAFGWESGRDLTQVKAELNALLARQKHKIIIFIDNIARIENEEIKQIFQIVKSMGDYVNTVYVLAMDREYVIRAMDQVYGGGGVQYLEKIVQLPFDIPEISKLDLENILLDRLSGIVKTLPESAWNQQAWADIYYLTLKYFFRDCRDITRYVNTLGFSFSRVKDLVNPVDFFAITALSVFSPKVYEGIRDNKDLFTDFIDHVFDPDTQKMTEDKLRCDAILDRVEGISRERLLQLLLHLFPRLKIIYQSDKNFDYNRDAARLDHRISDADVFDLYFRLSLPSGTMAESELNALLSLASDESAFSEAILRLNKDERIDQLLDALESGAIEKIDTKNISTVVDVFMNSADLFPMGESNLLRFNTPMRIHRILHQLLQRIDSSQKRFEILRESIKKSIMSLYIIIHELSVQTNADINLEELDVLKKLAVGKILYWAEIGRLSEHPKLLDILYAWKEWGNEDDCRRFVGTLVQEDRGLITFLLCALKTPVNQAMTKLAKNPEWENALKTIEDFIFTKILEPHAKMIFEADSFEKLKEEEQLAILIFLDLTHAKTVKIMPKIA